ncbi:MAG: ATP-dependent protease [Acidobacteria bacterium]|nr:ATP-dependent protease [Acidobacteriota bacterium]
MLPPTIPIFPLPNVVLFPNVFLPLHIFEERYRVMVADALRGDRTIGIVLLRQDYQAAYEGRPPIYAVGCAGVISHAERLEDGRYNIVLRGIEKFHVISEDHEKVYRLAQVEAIAEFPSAADREQLRKDRLRIEALMAAAIERTGADPKFSPAVPDEDLVNALAQYLEFEPIERQALLERDGILARCRGIIELLEMKTLTRGVRWPGRSVH